MFSDERDHDMLKEGCYDLDRSQLKEFIEALEEDFADFFSRAEALIQMKNNKEPKLDSDMKAHRREMQLIEVLTQIIDGQHIEGGYWTLDSLKVLQLCIRGYTDDFEVRAEL